MKVWIFCNFDGEISVSSVPPTEVDVADVSRGETNILKVENGCVSQMDVDGSYHRCPEAQIATDDGKEYHNV